MRKFYKYLVVWFLTPFVALVIGYQLISPIEWDVLQAHEKRNIVEKISLINHQKSNVNILIGDSRAANGLIPLNENWVNLSIHGSDPTTGLFYLRNLNPDLVDTIVFCFSPFQFQYDRYRVLITDGFEVGNLHVEPNKKTGISFFDDYPFIQENIFSKKILVLSQTIRRSELHNKIIHFHEQYGFWGMTKVDNNIPKKAQDEYNSDWNFKVTDLNRLSFAQLCIHFQKSLIVYCTTPHSEVIIDIDANYFRNFEMFISPQVDKVCFFHNEKLPYNLFSDGSHMNQNGAEIWSDMLKNCLFESKKEIRGIAK